jgi:hypothetical protein
MGRHHLQSGRAPARRDRARGVRLVCLVGACATLACGAPSRADESAPTPETTSEATPPPSAAQAAPSARAPNEPTAFERELDRWLARAAEITVHVGERGSGTIVSRDGLVLTAMHVVDELTVRWRDPRSMQRDSWSASSPRSAGASHRSQDRPRSRAFRAT